MTRWKGWISLAAALTSFAVLGVWIGQGLRHDVAARKTQAQALLAAYGQHIAVTLRHQYNYASPLRALLEAPEGSLADIGDRLDALMRLPGCVYLAVTDREKLVNVSSLSPLTAPDPAQPLPLEQLDYSYQLARLTRETVLEGPLDDNLTGRRVFLLIEPIKRDGEWQGEAAAALDADMLLNSLTLDELRQAGFDYEFWRIRPHNGSKETLALSSAGIDFSQAVEIKLKMPTAYTLSILPAGGWNRHYDPEKKMALAALFSAVLGFAVYGALNAHELRRALRDAGLRDAETGLPNRRGCLRRMAALPGPLTVLYLTVPGYAGLALLAEEEERTRYMEHWTDALERSVPFPHFAARVGEESFALVVLTGLNDGERTLLERELVLELLHKLKVQDREIFLTPVCGAARGPEDGDDGETLLRHAIQDCRARLSREKRRTETDGLSAVL